MGTGLLKDYWQSAKALLKGRQQDCSQPVTAATQHTLSEVDAVRFDVVTLFPDLVDHAMRFGIPGRARERGLWSLGTVNPRDFATDAHRTVDDRPYGGGPGMVMLAEPLALAIQVARTAQRTEGCAMTRVVYLSPSSVR